VRFTSDYFISGAKGSFENEKENVLEEITFMCKKNLFIFYEY
jgi:hypothetical protein